MIFVSFTQLFIYNHPKVGSPQFNRSGSSHFDVTGKVGDRPSVRFVGAVGSLDLCHCLNLLRYMNPPLFLHCPLLVIATLVGLRHAARLQRYGCVGQHAERKAHESEAEAPMAHLLVRVGVIQVVHVSWSRVPAKAHQLRQRAAVRECTAVLAAAVSPAGSGGDERARELVVAQDAHGLYRCYKYATRLRPRRDLRFGLTFWKTVLGVDFARNRARHSLLRGA